MIWYSCLLLFLVIPPQMVVIQAGTGNENPGGSGAGIQNPEATTTAASIVTIATVPSETGTKSNLSNSEDSQRADPAGTNTTKDPLAEAHTQIKQELTDLLTLQIGHTAGNAEYQNQISKVRSASTWGQNRYAEQVRTAVEFHKYNNERLELEESISDRIDEVDNKIPEQQPGSKCSKFYTAQKRALEKAMIRSNKKKIELLKNNSSECISETGPGTDEYEYE